jgi:hypothetical protein
MVHGMTSLLLLSSLIVGSMSVSLEEYYSSQPLWLVYAYMTTIVTLPEYFMLYRCYEKQKFGNAGKLEVYKGMVAVIFGTGFQLVSCALMTYHSDLHMAYYFSLQAGKIAMLEVFNSSLLNNMKNERD